MPGKLYVKAESCVQQFLPQTRKTPSQAPYIYSASAAADNWISKVPLNQKPGAAAKRVNARL